MKNCHVAAKELAVSLLEPSLHAVSVLHAAVRAEDVGAVRTIANLVTRNQRNGLVVGQRGTPARRRNRHPFGILRWSGSADRNVRHDQLLQVMKAITVAGLGLHSSLLSFRTFRPGKKPSVAWQSERHLKSTRGGRKPAVGATADDLRVAGTDLTSDV